MSWFFYESGSPSTVLRKLQEYKRTVSATEDEHAQILEVMAMFVTDMERWVRECKNSTGTMHLAATGYSSDGTYRSNKNFTYTLTMDKPDTDESLQVGYALFGKPAADAVDHAPVTVESENERLPF